jgi:hypothetical protein
MTREGPIAAMITCCRSPYLERRISNESPAGPFGVAPERPDLAPPVRVATARESPAGARRRRLPRLLLGRVAGAPRFPRLMGPAWQAARRTSRFGVYVGKPMGKETTPLKKHWTCRVAARIECRPNRERSSCCGDLPIRPNEGMLPLDSPGDGLLGSRSPQFIVLEFSQGKVHPNNRKGM